MQKFWVVIVVFGLSACNANKVVCPKPGQNSSLQSAGGGSKMKSEKNRYDKDGRIKR